MKKNVLFTAFVIITSFTTWIYCMVTLQSAVFQPTFTCQTEVLKNYVESVSELQIALVVMSTAWILIVYGAVVYYAVTRLSKIEQNS